MARILHLPRLNPRQGDLRHPRTKAHWSNKQLIRSNTMNVIRDRGQRKGKKFCFNSELFDGFNTSSQCY